MAPSVARGVTAKTVDGAHPATDQQDEKTGSTLALRIWLTLVLLLVVGMVLVGGATRLTDSGLSITEWQPLLGAIPPLTDADWHTAFEKYKLIPQYTQVNEGMSLAAFKSIFWWEWAHRFLGRFIGLAFAFPLAWFWIRGAIPKGWHVRLLGVLLLGGIQGFVGWYMVKSGLVDRVDVNQYRLALHLSVAFLILGVLTWFILDLDRPSSAIYLHDAPAGTAVIGAIIALLVYLQVALGAFVAGTKAGTTYNTWPLMDGQLIPSGLFSDHPWWMNFTENLLTIQFNHRLTAYVLIVVAAIQAFRVSRIDDSRVSRSAIILAVMIVCQAALGIWTLLSAEGHIPIGQGLAHQTFAACVLIAAVWHLHCARRAR